MTAPSIELTDATRDRIAYDAMHRYLAQSDSGAEAPVVLAAVRAALEAEIAPPQTRTYTVTITNSPELRWLPDAEQVRVALRHEMRVGSVGVEVVGE